MAESQLVRLRLRPRSEDLKSRMHAANVKQEVLVIIEAGERKTILLYSRSCLRQKFIISRETGVKN